MKMQIVDEQDKIIGHKKRDEVDYDRDIYRSSALWVVNAKGEVLIAQRKLTKDRDPGMWGPSVAGTVEEGETYESNAYKEAEEEVGLTGYVFTKIDKVKIDDARHQFMQWYIVEVNEPAEFFTPQPEEVEQVAWIGIDELHDDVRQNPKKYVPYMELCLEVLNRALPLAGEAIYVQSPSKTITKYGVDITLYDPSASNNGIVYEEVSVGHLQEFYNDVSTYQWFIIDGEGVFVIDDEKFPVMMHDLVTVPPKKRVHYFGNMKMILITNPRFNPENEHQVRIVDASESPFEVKQ